jgi:hypothetical protein
MIVRLEWIFKRIVCFQKSRKHLKAPRDIDLLKIAMNALENVGLQ